MHFARSLMLWAVLLLAGCGMFDSGAKQLSVAQQSLAAGDYGAAVVALRNVLGGEADNTAARLLLARALFMQGDVEAGQRELSDAVRRGAEAAAAAEIQAQMNLATGAAQAVLDVADDPRSPLAEERRSYYRARALQASQRIPEAMVIFRELLAARPQSPDLQLRIAQGHAVYGRLSMARDALGKALSLSTPADELPVTAEAWLLKATLEQREGNIAARDEALRNALQAAPGEFTIPQEAQLLTAAIDRALTAGDPIEAERLHGRLVRILPQAPLTQMVRAQLQATQDPANAVTGLQTVLQQQPENPAARGLLVAALLHSGALEQALKEANTLIAAAPGGSESRALGELIRTAASRPAGSTERALAVAGAQLALQQPALARASLQAALDQDQHDVDLKLALARVELRAGRNTEARGLAESLVRNETGNPAALVVLAESQAASGDYKAAAATYASLWPSTRSARLALALAQARQRAGLPYAEPLREWLQTHPRDVSVRLELAAALQQNGDDPAAIHEYERLLADVPGDSPQRSIALNNLAWLYSRKDDPRALETARRAYEGARDAASIQDTYGWLLVQHDRVPEALPLLKAAAEGFPASAEIRYHYAVALARSGDRGGARLLLQDILQAPDSFDGRQEATQLLATL
ncbi:MAG: tetratricopeptide repeat protein [Pseudomonadota bacterium]|nr:tetratricopeptide repeat protein [Pseudomonadota bacterium]